MGDDNFGGLEGSFTRDVVEQLAERLAERQNFSEVLRGEVGARAGRTCTLPADLNDANDVAIQENRRTDHLLNRFGSFPGDLHTLKNGCVPRGGEIILDLRPAI